MNTILELQEKRNQAWNDAKAFVDKQRDSDGLLSEEDAKTYEGMEMKVKNFSAENERLEAMERMENDLLKPMNKPLTSNPMNDNNIEVKTGRASNEYKEGMLTALRSNFRQVNNILAEGTDAAGGYLVPEEYDKRLIDGLTEENIIRTLGTTIATTGERKINIAGNKPAASWIEEGGNLVFEDATFGQILLDAHKLHVAVKVTEELLYDNAFNLEGYIIDQFTKALSNAEEDAFLNGNGVGRPLGLLHPTGGGQVAVTTSAAATISADEIVTLIYKLKRPYRKNAAFITNDDTLSVLRKLKDGNGAYLWQPSLQQGEPDTLLGYKIYTSPYVPTIASGQPVLAFGDFSYYNIGDRGQRSFAELKELFAGNGLVAFLAKERVDGKLVLPEAVQILKIKGTPTPPTED